MTTVESIHFRAASFLVILGVGGYLISGPITASAPEKQELEVRKESPEKLPLSEGEARRTARLLSEVLRSTLFSIHRNYFKPPLQQPIPSRALEDVFFRVSRHSGITMEWLAVNAHAMSIEHRPDDDFERRAVRALDRGKSYYEETLSGEYRRADSITLFSNCIKCHTSSKPAPVAAIVVRVPLEDS